MEDQLPLESLQDSNSRITQDICQDLDTNSQVFREDNLYTDVDPAQMVPANFPTLFGQVSEPDVTFCIDTSGSMVYVLDAVKEHLIETLIKIASDSSDHTFNIVQFNSEVTQWSDKMVKCTPQTVAVASHWLNKLEAKTGTNTRDALLTAFSDGQCEAVYLVTDGLPDQNPSEILDHVSYACDNRPIHCFYIQGGSPDPAATEFLQDLAMETYGSFHIITATEQGNIERITPIYKAEASAECIVRSTDRNIHSLTDKVCSVAATLKTPPEDFLVHPLVVQSPVPYSCLNPYYPTSMYHWYFHPTLGWSHYRPCRSWISGPGHFSDEKSYAPGPGAMLLGTEVLARRNEDGYFYVGIVKSQILENKFLVELRPCKHGKFRKISYQETYVYDIISLTDALRHAVMTGDKVLAPWEPEGDRYAPGTVVDGAERREAQGGCETGFVTVAFHNGKTTRVQPETAIWIPPALHERITFELQLPSDVRREFAEQEAYPEKNWAGYPATSVDADQKKYKNFEPVMIDRGQGSREEGLYKYPYYVPIHPIYYKHQPKNSAIHSEDVDDIIPGTNLTKSQLNEKVMSQLMEHKLSLDYQSPRLLKKRGKIRDSSLQKSVSFEDRNYKRPSNVEEEYESGDLEITLTDSGRGSASDIEFDEDDIPGSSTERKNKPFHKKKPKRPISPSKPRPQWKYWNAEPIPSLMEPMNYGPYRVGPYENSASIPPLEARPINSQYGVEWTSPVTKVVDPYSKYRHEVTTKDALHMPRPPQQRYTVTRKGKDVDVSVNVERIDPERKAELRQEFRRQQVMGRQAAWSEQLQDRELQKSRTDEYHRQRTAAQMDRDRQRHREEYQTIEHQREAKRAISSEIRQQGRERQLAELGREQQKLETIQARRIQRDEQNVRQQQEMLDTSAQQQAAREQRATMRSHQNYQRVAEEVMQNAARDHQVHKAHMKRIEHFRTLESDRQKERDAKYQIKEQNLALYRSQVLP